jgi:hypothetical protein
MCPIVAHSNLLATNTKGTLLASPSVLPVAIAYFFLAAFFAGFLAAFLAAFFVAMVFYSPFSM